MVSAAPVSNAAGRVDHGIRERPASTGRGGLGELESERLLALDPPARLLEGRDREVAARQVLGLEERAGLADRRAFEFERDARRVAKRRRRDVALDRHRCLGRHRDDDVQVAGERVADERVAGIALRRHRQLAQAEATRLGRDHRHAAVLEALRRVRAEAWVRAALVLEREPQARSAGDRVIAVVEERRVALAEADDVARIGRVGGVEGEQGAEAPHVEARGAVPLGLRLLRGEALEIEDDLDRSPVDRVEVHDRVERVFDAGGEAAQASGVRHGRAV
jgi:hypothetical protein